MEIVKEITEKVVEPYSENKYFYCYSLSQVKYLIKNRCTVIAVGLGEKNSDIWFRFINNEKLRKLVDVWFDR